MSIDVYDKDSLNHVCFFEYATRICEMHMGCAPFGNLLPIFFIIYKAFLGVQFGLIQAMEVDFGMERAAEKKSKGRQPLRFG